MLFSQIRVNSYFRAPVVLCTYLVIYYLFAIMSPPLDCQLSKRILLISNPILYPQCLLCFGTKQVLNKCCTNKWSQSSAYLNSTLPSRPSSLYKPLLDHSSPEASQPPLNSNKSLAQSLIWQLLMAPILMTYINNFS